MTGNASPLEVVRQHLETSRQFLAHGLPKAQTADDAEKVAADDPNYDSPNPDLDTIGSVSELWRAVEALRGLLDFQSTVANSEESRTNLARGRDLLVAVNSGLHDDLNNVTADTEDAAELVKFAGIVGADDELAPEMVRRTLGILSAMVTSNATAIVQLSDVVGTLGNLVVRLYQVLGAGHPVTEPEASNG